VAIPGDTLHCLFSHTYKLSPPARAGVCVCVCVLLWPCTRWAWAVTTRQLCTFCSVPSAPVQKPTMSPARPMPHSILNKGNAKKVIRYCIRQAVQLVELSRPQGMSSVVRF
jgi:hypothetical protein